jgi:hypothetical protein
LSFLNGFDLRSFLVAENWASNNIFLGVPVAQVKAVMIVSEHSNSSLCIRPTTSSSRGDRLQCHDLQVDSQEPGWWAHFLAPIICSGQEPLVRRLPFCPSATYGQRRPWFMQTNLSFALRMTLTSHDYDVLCFLDRDQFNKVSVSFTLLGVVCKDDCRCCFDTHVLGTLGPP